MIDYSNPVALTMRRFGQKLGVLRPIVRLYRNLANKNYEEGFDKLLLDEVRAGDIVWDIGANVGFYTKKFAEKVGPSGHVVAFEPAPQTLETLKAAVAQFPYVTILPVALSDQAGLADFLVDDHDVTNSLAVNSKDGDIIQVQVARGDDVARDQLPNVMKIDVEGFELEVVDGITQTLAHPQLRAVFVEVHFLEIEKRGRSAAIANMKQALQNAGLAIHWIDPSHLVARRSA